MATWTISDELDARLRKHLGIQDPAAFAERVLTDHLDEAEEDPAYTAELDRKIEQSMKEFEAGRGIDAIEGMLAIAAEKGINLER